MTLSIIIPTYNSAKVLGRALTSIKNQTFHDYEILVMDGVSSDDTIRIALSLSDSNVHVYSETDKGVYDAMNKGIEKSNGEWLYFLGSDDYLVDNTVLENIFSNDLDCVDVIYGDVESNHLSPNYSGPWSIDRIDYNRCHQGIFYRRSVFKKCGMYSLKYPVLADHDMNLKWFLSTNIVSKYIPVTISHFSEGGISNVMYDEAFHRDFHRLILVRGWRLLNHEERKFHLYQQMQLYRFGKTAIRFWNKLKKISYIK